MPGRKKLNHITIKTKRKENEDSTRPRAIAVLDHANKYLERGSGWMVKGRNKIQKFLPTGTAIGKTFTLDQAFSQKSKTHIYQKSLRKIVLQFCQLKQSTAIIVCGGSTAAKTSFIRSPKAPADGFLHSAVNDIFKYMRNTKKVMCQLRVSFVEVYNEKLEDLLATDLYNDIKDAPQPELWLARDEHRCVFWPNAQHKIITEPSQVHQLYVYGHNEHVVRGRRTENRMKASHSIFRITLESVERDIVHTNWDTVKCAVAHLDFVRVGHSTNVHPFTTAQDKFNYIPPYHRSLHELRSFLLHRQGDRNALYDDHQALLTQILRNALIGSSHSIFFLICDPLDFQETRETLRLGVAAKNLTLYPKTFTYSGTGLQHSIKKLLTQVSELGLVLDEKGDMKFGPTKLTNRERRKLLKEFKSVCGTVFPNSQDIESQKSSQKKNSEPLTVEERIKLRKAKQEEERISLIADPWRKLRKMIKNTSDDSLSEVIESMSNDPKYRKRERLMTWTPVYKGGDTNIDVYMKPRMVRGQRVKNKHKVFCLGSLCKVFKPNYYGGCITTTHTSEDSDMSTQVKGVISTKSDARYYFNNILPNFLHEDFNFTDFKGKKVCFPLDKVHYDKFIVNDNEPSNFFRLTEWILHVKDKLQKQDEEGKVTYTMPDFIAVKEVFLDMYLTPYRRTYNPWKFKAVIYDDDRVYIQHDRTMAQTHFTKMHYDEAFNAFLSGRFSHARDDKDYETKYPGANFQVLWADVKGIGLMYTSKVDMANIWLKPFVDTFANKRRSPNTFGSYEMGEAFAETHDSPDEETTGISKAYKTFKGSHEEAFDGILNSVEFQRQFVYKTHLYPVPPIESDFWKNHLWCDLLEWWADYQFSKIPNIICGEMHGKVVKNLRIFHPPHLPALSTLLRRVRWDAEICEQFLAKLLHFIKYNCTKKRKEVLSFELQQNGDVACYGQKYNLSRLNIFEKGNEVVTHLFASSFYGEGEF